MNSSVEPASGGLLRFVAFWIGLTTPFFFMRATASPIRRQRAACGAGGTGSGTLLRIGGIVRR